MCAVLYRKWRIIIFILRAINVPTLCEVPENYMFTVISYTLVHVLDIILNLYMYLTVYFLCVINNILVSYVFVLYEQICFVFACDT